MLPSFHQSAQHKPKPVKYHIEQGTNTEMAMRKRYFVSQSKPYFTPGISNNFKFFEILCAVSHPNWVRTTSKMQIDQVIDTGEAIQNATQSTRRTVILIFGCVK
jgi:hypothetical protein